MAACGGIEHIFEKPLPESPNFLEALSPLKHNNIDDSSFTEILGELHFKETPPSSSSNQEREQYRHKKSFSSDSLSLCTEGLGFESFDDVEETRSHEDLCCRDEDVDGERNVRRNERGEAARASRAAFPPPISCIGRSGKPWVWFKSCREDGRFILKQVRIPTQEILHSCRQDGRLQLHFLHSDDEAHHQDVEFTEGHNQE